MPGSGFQNLPMVKGLQLNIEKLLGKGRNILSTTKKNNKVENFEETENFNDIDDEDIESFDMSIINNFNSENENDVDRVRRNLRKNVDVQKSVKKAKKSTPDFSNKSGIGYKTRKSGYVNIDLVPTQIVTLRNKKENKLKKLLNIFHRNKKNIHKRDNQRAQRFSLKKIKDIFLSKSDDKLNDKAIDALDYDLLTTRLTGLKPYKFDRVYSLEDMRKQIPNITDDLKDNIKINEMINDYDLKQGSYVTDITKDNLSLSDFTFSDNFLDKFESQLQATLKATVDKAGVFKFSN